MVSVIRLEPRRKTKRYGTWVLGLQARSKIQKKHAEIPTNY
ncbi:3465_t:CDS:2 [Funneliformis geosporum]|nr:3465_t:CDS:2 [Funneliformis geosporum]